MKKMLLVVLSLVFSFSLIAQKDVTRFLGIPVDGSKSEMIKKLKEKGFVSSEFDKEILEGEFNGTDVYIHVVTNNNKVYRIMVADRYGLNENEIIIRFNRLCSQFENNGKYVHFDENFIPEGEDISYEMTVNSKRYQAVYYQIPDTAKLKSNFVEFISDRYTKEEVEGLSEEERVELIIEMIAAEIPNRTVWFMIDEAFGSYKILMYYDNEYNQANGEDL